MNSKNSALACFAQENIRELIFSFTNAETCIKNQQLNSLKSFQKLSILTQAIIYNNINIFQQYCVDLSAVTFQYLTQQLLTTTDLENYEQFVKTILDCNVNFTRQDQQKDILSALFNNAIHRKNETFLKIIIKHQYFKMDIQMVITTFHKSMEEDDILSLSIYSALPLSVREKDIGIYDCVKRAIFYNNTSLLDILLDDFKTTPYYEKIFLDYAIRMDNLEIVKYLVEKRRFKLDKTFKKNAAWIIRDYISTTLLL